MKAPSPLRLISSFALNWLSFPVRGFLQWRQQSILSKRRVVWIQLDASTSSTWRIKGEGFNGLEQIAQNSAIKTIVFDVRSCPAGWANMADFHQKLKAIVSSGKSIFVLLQTADARALAVFSCADRIWVQTGLEMFWIGIGGRHTFYKGLMDQLGVQADIEAAGSFKSFGEVYTRSEPSEANRLQMTELYSDLHQQMLEWLTEHKQIDLDILKGLFQESPVSPDRLVELGLIDGEMYQDELLDRVQEFTNSVAEPVSFGRFLRRQRWIRRFSWGQMRNAVVMLHLEGSITDHERDQDGIVADRIIPVLKSLREYDHIQTIVLNINSPGGSAMASDRIAREVRILAASKNVVALLGNIAASGGYYIASAATSIIASGQTITGSIGVVGGKLVLGGALERQGVQSHTIAATEDTDMLDWWRPFSDDQRLRFRASLERTYERFCQVVSKGRTLPMHAVYDVAQGRVWTGRQALSRGLVDHLGGFEHLRTHVANQEGVSETEIQWVHYDFQPSSWKRWIAQLVGLRQSDVTQMILAKSPSVVQLLHSHPLEALTVLPIDLDGES